MIRRFNDYIIVSVNEGSIYINEVFWKNKNIVNEIRSGDKFYTKMKYLDLKNRGVSFINKNKRMQLRLQRCHFEETSCSQVFYQSSDSKL